MNKNQRDETATASTSSWEALAVQAQYGDARALEQLSREVREPLRVFLVQRLPKDVDAEDIAQETLLRALDHLGSYDPTRAFQTWLFTIGKRLAINHVIAEQRRQERHCQAYVPVEVNTSADGDEHQTWERARAVLSDESYRALWMRYARDASVKEVATALNRTLISTKVLLFRARKRLLLELQK